MKETTPGAAMVEPKGTKTAPLNETKLLRKRQNQLRKTALKPMRHRWHDRSDEGGEGIADDDDDDDDDNDNDDDEGGVGEASKNGVAVAVRVQHGTRHQSVGRAPEEGLPRAQLLGRLDIPKSRDAPDVALQFSLTRRRPRSRWPEAELDQLIAANTGEQCGAESSR